jgi:hypothetical protein
MMTFRHNLTLITILLIFMSTPAMAQEEPPRVMTFELMEVCQEALQIMDEERDFPPDTGEGLSCYHYFKGYRDAIFVERSELVNFEDVCIPANMSNEQLIRLFMDAAKDVSEEHDEPASIALGGILEGALPCTDLPEADEQGTNEEVLR